MKVSRLLEAVLWFSRGNLDKESLAFALLSVPVLMFGIQLVVFIRCYCSALLSLSLPPPISVTS